MLGLEEVDRFLASIDGHDLEFGSSRVIHAGEENPLAIRCPSIGEFV
jgi:hypothetical protein